MSHNLPKLCTKKKPRTQRSVALYAILGKGKVGHNSHHTLACMAVKDKRTFFSYHVLNARGLTGVHVSLHRT